MLDFFKKKEETEKDSKPNHLLRVIAGGYLAYLGISNVRSILNGTSDASNPVLFGIIFVLFAIAGVFAFVVGVIGLVKSREENMAETARKYAEETGYNSETDTYETTADAVSDDTAEIGDGSDNDKGNE